MTRTIFSCAVAFVATVGFLLPGSASAATANVPDGVTGLWLFEQGASLSATIGADLIDGDGPGGSGTEFGGVNMQIGTESDPFLYQNPGVIQTLPGGYYTAPHGIAPNGGGSNVNEYTILMDFIQTVDIGQWNSLLQFGSAPEGSDGEIFTNTNGTIGVGASGYSAATYDPNQWHRLVVSGDIGTSYKIFIDGVKYLDSTTTEVLTVDGRFSLDPTNFHVLADNDGETRWGLLANLMVWDNALSDAEVAALGSYADPSNANFPTPLIFSNPVPEPSAVIIAGLGLCGLVAFRRKK